MSVLEEPREYYVSPKQLTEQRAPEEIDITNVLGSMCAEVNVSRHHYFVQDFEQEDHARACIHDWTEVISELYNFGRGRHAKQIFDLINA